MVTMGLSNFGYSLTEAGKPLLKGTVYRSLVHRNHLSCHCSSFGPVYFLVAYREHGGSVENRVTIQAFR